jgi:hypothetical protein
LQKKYSAAPGVAEGTEHEVQCVTRGVDRAIQVGPLAMHLDVGLIDPPRIVRWVELDTHPFFELRSITLDPAVDGGVVHVESAFGHNLCEVTIAEGVT